MTYNPQFDYQRVVNNPGIYNYNNNIIQVGNQNFNFNTNDPNALCLSGNAYTIKTKGDEIMTQGLQQREIKSLRINMSGSIMQSFNLCCWITTIVLGSIFLFPLFFVCCDWWKRKAFQTFTTDPAGYEGVGKLIQYSGVQEIYLTIQDNYFNSAKAHMLIQAISHSRIQNVTITNIVPGFNTLDSNYSDFTNYMRPMLQYVRFAEISWGRQFVR